MNFLDYDFITYGGFDVLLNSFRAITQIFGDSAYTSTYWALAVLAVSFLFTNSYISAAAGTSFGYKINLYDWVASFWWAIFFFYVMIVPKGTIHLYDNKHNQYQAIGNLPVGVVALAGITNEIEETLSDLAEMAFSPLIGFEDAANGIGFNILRDLYTFTDKAMFPDEDDRLNLDSYLRDCVVHGILAGDIDVERVKKTEDYMTDVLALADYNYIFTLDYVNGSSNEMTCKASYNSNIRNVFTLTYWENNFLRPLCETKGFDLSTASGLQACKEVIETIMSNMIGSSAISSTLMQQAVITKKLNDIVQSGDETAAISVLGAKSTGTSMLSAGIMANDFLPIFRNIMMAIAISLTPIVFLFYTMFAKKAFTYWLGSYIWVMLWGIVDVILSGFAINYAYDVFAELRVGKLGYDSLFLFDQESTKVLGVLGYMRTFGAMLSMGMVNSIMQFGSYSLAQATGALQGKMDSSGQKAGLSALTVEGRANTLSSLDSSMAAMSNQYSYDFNSRVDSLRNSGASRHGAGMGLQSQDKAYNTGKYGSEHTVGTNFGREKAAHLHGTSIEGTAEARAAREFSQESKRQEVERTDMGTQNATMAAIKTGDFMGEKMAKETTTERRLGANDKIDSKYGLLSGTANAFEKMMNEGKDIEGLQNRVDESGVSGAQLLFNQYGGDSGASLDAVKESFRKEQDEGASSFAERSGEFKGATSAAQVSQDENILTAWGKGLSAEDKQSFEEYKRNGVLDKNMAGIANKLLTGDAEQGPFVAGMKVEERDWGVYQDEDGLSRMTINRANMQTKDGLVKVENGKVTKEGTYDSVGALRKAGELAEEGHMSTAHGLTGMIRQEAINERIKELRSSGNLDEAKGLEGLRNQFRGHFSEPGTGLTEDESMSFRSVQSFDGKEAEFSAKHGSRSEWENISRRTSGVDERILSQKIDQAHPGKYSFEGDDAQYGLAGEMKTVGEGRDRVGMFSGNIATPDGRTFKGTAQLSGGNLVNISGEDGKSFRNVDIDNQTKERLDTLRQGSVREAIDRDISTLDRGTQITPNAMLNSVITKDRVINDRISDAATTAQREQEVVQQNIAFAEGLSEIMSRKGKILSYSEAGGKGHLKASTPFESVIGGAGAEANVGIGRRNQEEQNYDLYYGMASRITSNAINQSRGEGGAINWESFDELRMKGFNELYSGTNELASGKTDFEFGASGIIGEPMKVAKGYINKIR